MSILLSIISGVAILYVFHKLMYFWTEDRINRESQSPVNNGEYFYTKTL